ncbi:CDP-alcohol phosphatidyltransferase family protein [Massilia sp. YMA4]|uniref:CDP-alcohol phosphatidyltransferase family protein n=1 Tax=Massilia sp. YMA4 TaxID=1593482 RepID=UPI001877DE34|nr:CDP-alcohol phosphatidyltransferase family protein [Massilia sp. YMA4]
MKKLIPWLLVLSRIVLAPVAIWLAVQGLPAWLWMCQFAAAALSDWFDGKLARRWGTATPGLRQADSIADTVYTLAIVVSLWFSHRDIVLAHCWGIALVIALEAARYPLDWWRFGRGASYHAQSAKLFGVSLLVAVSAIVMFDDAGPWLWLALAIGVVSELEGMLISLVLPAWTHDVRSLRRALELRRLDGAASGPAARLRACRSRAAAGSPGPARQRRSR